MKKKFSKQFSKQFWQYIKDSSISFVVNNRASRKMLESYIGCMEVEARKGEKMGKSTDKYFKTLETIAQKLIKIHGFETFADIYHTERYLVKGELKNTFNFAFMLSIHEE